MQRNTLHIVINRPVSDVFAFTIDPKNTPQWIAHIQEEETNEWPVRVGTIYRNRGKSDEWSDYIVTQIDTDRIFELQSKDGTYHVRYTYKPMDTHQTEMEYEEWVDAGELSQPFTQGVMRTLQSALEEY